MARAKKVYVEEVISADGIDYKLSGVSINDGSRVTGSNIRVHDLVSDMEKGKIHRDVLLQRTEGQWNRNQKSALVISILKEIPIGTILMTEPKNSRNEKSEYPSSSVLDGLQRITTIRDFVSGKFSIVKGTRPLHCEFEDEDGNIIVKDIDISGLNFSKLPKVFQDMILNYQLNLNIYRGFTDEELDEIVFTVNNGTRFKPNQKIRTTLGSKVMRKIQPIIDNEFWDCVSDCNAKNDTTLACVMRSLMLIVRHDWDNISNKAIGEFAVEFAKNPDEDSLDYLAKMYNKLFDAAKLLTDEQKEFFNAVTVQHLIMCFDMFEDEYEITPEHIVAFLNRFNGSDAESDFYVYYTGLGGKEMYDMDNVDARQKIIEGDFELYLLDCRYNNTIIKKQEDNDNVCTDDTGIADIKADTTESDGQAENGRTEDNEYSDAEGDVGVPEIGAEGQDDTTVSEDE